MKCQYCNKEAEWVENKEVYGKNYGKSYMIWLCHPCDAYVGCHENSQKPKGTLANAELRKWRIKAHEAFDPIWRKSKGGKYKKFNNQKRRIKAYGWLARELKSVAFHIGESDIEACKKIIEFCLKRRSLKSINQ